MGQRADGTDRGAESRGLSHYSAPAFLASLADLVGPRQLLFAILKSVVGTTVVTGLLTILGTVVRVDWVQTRPKFKELFDVPRIWLLICARVCHSALPTLS